MEQNSLINVLKIKLICELVFLLVFTLISSLFGEKLFFELISIFIVVSMIFGLYKLIFYKKYENKKYKLLKQDSKIIFGKTLYRIQSLTYLNNVKPGDLGGYIENEHNLSRYGDCWVSEDAIVMDNAIVEDNAEIKGNAKIRGNTKITGNACVKDNADISGNAKIGGNSKIFGNACIKDNVEISGDASVFGNVEISDSVKILDSVKIFGYAKLSGNIFIFGNASIKDFVSISGNVKVSGNAEIKGNALVKGNAWIDDEAIITDETDYFTVESISNIGIRNIRKHKKIITVYKSIKNLYVKVGHLSYSINEFIEEFEINDNKEEYMLIIELIKKYGMEF